MKSQYLIDDHEGLSMAILERLLAGRADGAARPVRGSEARALSGTLGSRAAHAAIGQTPADVQRQRERITSHAWK